VRSSLDPWPGAQSVFDEEWFPLLRTRERVLSVFHQLPADPAGTRFLRPSPDDRLAGYGRVLQPLFANVDDEARTIRAALANFTRASLAVDAGESALYLAMCLEGLLTKEGSKDSTTARVTEAAANYAGGRRQQREANRKCAERLYAVRSSYVHRGNIRPRSIPTLAADIGQGLHLVRDVLRRELLDFASTAG
jgi:hypothetical protein